MNRKLFAEGRYHVKNDEVKIDLSVRAKSATIHANLKRSGTKQLPSINSGILKQTKKTKCIPAASKIYNSSWKKSPYFQSAVGINTVNFRPYSCHERVKTSAQNVKCTKKCSKSSSASEKVLIINQQLNQCPYIANGHRIFWLSLKGNHISQIENLQHLTNLSVADVSDNNLSSLRGFNDLTTLSVLLVGQNRISNANHVGNLKNLTVVDLHSNELSSVRELTELPKLRILNVSYNYLTVVDFANFSVHLSEINISHNEIQQIINAHKLISLDMLDASHNCICSFKDIRDVLKSRSLSKLFVHNNPMSDDDCHKQILLCQIPSLIQLDSINTTVIKSSLYKALKEPEEETSSYKFPTLSSGPNTFQFDDVGEEIQNICNGLPSKVSLQRSRSLNCTIKKLGSGNEILKSKTYAIQINDKTLNLHGPDAIHKCLNRTWKSQTLNTIDTMKFDHINFKSVSSNLSQLLHEFTCVSHLSFTDNQIESLHQLNVFATVRNIRSIEIFEPGNCVTNVKLWRLYLVYRAAHLGLAFINGVPVTTHEIQQAEQMFYCLANTAYSQLPLFRLSSMLASPTCQYELISGSENVKTSLQKDGSDSTCKEHHAITKTILTHPTDSEAENEDFINGFIDDCFNKCLVIKERQLKFSSALDDHVMDVIKTALDDFSDIQTYMKDGYAKVIDELIKCPNNK